MLVFWPMGYNLGLSIKKCTLALRVQIFAKIVYTHLLSFESKITTNQLPQNCSIFVTKWYETSKMFQPIYKKCIKLASQNHKIP